MNLINKNNEFLISAKELYDQLGIKRDYSSWIKQSIERAGLETDKDFTPFKVKTPLGRPLIDYLLKRDAALTIIVMSGGQFAKDLRKQVIELYNQHDTGLAFTASQVEALMDLSRAMTLVSIQKNVERQHFDVYNDKYSWYEYRAALLGYKTTDLIEGMRLVNKKHSTIRESLIHLDANELIRTGVIDFMIVMGKTQEYATNVGNLCKSMAQKMKLGNIIWDDTKPNPLGINSSEVNERMALLNTATQKSL
jgi:phage anti-repressor protein